MNAINTLSQLVTQSGCQYQVYDLGRRVTPITCQDFENIEQGRQAYPYPVQKRAQFALAYWNQEQQPWIWFLTFPLDERGLLNAADIGQYLQYIVQAIGHNLAAPLSEEQQEHLANNPYNFKPKEDKLAVFNSQLSVQLALPASQFYAPTQAYFRSPSALSNWQHLGLQGISDYCCRLNEDNNLVHLIDALPQLPLSPLYALLGMVEHLTPPKALLNALEQRLYQQAQAPDADIFLISALLRAVSGAAKSQQQAVLSWLWANPHLCHKEVLIAVAGRNWHWLDNPIDSEAFLLQLAKRQDQALFNQLFADLVMLPQLRQVILPLLHSQPSAELAQALLQLQQATRG
ncbi:MULTISPECIES: DUF3549 family protein [unclassified Vibrio]|uniref:DUF3549 family protein n=1 Tax=Vibrio sp. HB236076 TaxID=3232307 RepID=A0AB39HHV2_9VIBR|nr:DUF3549 family protein [Vibrio sp. HB161653]MDP5254866.1 DUF3549 family protein [Vibrio sp. HB161653]